MKHIELFEKIATQDAEKAFLKKATGKYYTHASIVDRIVENIVDDVLKHLGAKKKLRLIDPFCGDGRFIISFMSIWKERNLPSVIFDIFIWDVDTEAAIKAEQHIDSIDGLDINVHKFSGDSFHQALDYFGTFDLVLTNPPWENIKPDRREVGFMSLINKRDYLAQLKEFDIFLESQYSLSQPQRKFAGWGTNLSRVGLELSIRLLNKGGSLGIVLPASFLADGQSVSLRQNIYANQTINRICFYPAEAKLFEKADVESVSIILKNEANSKLEPQILLFDKKLNEVSNKKVSFSPVFLRQNGYVLPISLGTSGMLLLEKLSSVGCNWWGLEKSIENRLWSGREIDETGSKAWLNAAESEGPLFVKGRMVSRYLMSMDSEQRVEKPGWESPKSVGFKRIVWRDVSRSSQKRRIIATIIDKGLVAGNSLGVAYIENDDGLLLHALLGIMNSLCFEFQVRSHLATGHVSLSALRKVAVPSMKVISTFSVLAEFVEGCIGGEDNEFIIEAYVARYIYKLELSELEELLKFFPKINDDDARRILALYHDV